MEISYGIMCRRKRQKKPPFNLPPFLWRAPVGELLVARGLHLVQIGNDAPKSCELDRDYAGNSKPRYIAHYETPNLSQLPESLAKELRSGRYKTAAVGACAAKPSSGFSRFRIVVLLY